ncbi:MAG: hypothetical protein RMJ87_02740 [Cytophagales bacterium]|nr:MFS transporter [Bernardetiaceae bacterium]MDW8203923.1 hypothetical protein [Cytophagales bacterium]
MNVFRLRNVMYWCYGIAATLIFSANFVGMAAYQYDIEGASLENIGLYRELATLLSGLLLAGVIPAVGIRKVISFCFLLIAGLSALVFIYPTAWGFVLLYVVLGLAFGGLQIGFTNELASLNSQQAGLLSDVSHLEAVYVVGILVITLVSGLLMQYQQIELHHLYIVAAVVCAAIGIVAIKKASWFAQQPSVSAKAVMLTGWRAFLQLFRALGSTLVILAMACLGFMVATTTYLLNWIHFFNTTTLQLSDTLLWQFSIIIAISTICGRLVVAALVHYLRLLTILQVLLIASIGCVMGFCISYYQYPAVAIPDTMAELPTPILFVIVAAFFNGGVVPILTGTITYHTPALQRGVILGLITFVMSLATLTGTLAFQWSSKMFTPVVLLALIAIPLAVVLILSILFITDLRKSTSALST